MNLFDMLSAPLGSPEQQAITALGLGLMNNPGGRRNPMPGLLMGMQGAGQVLAQAEDKRRAVARQSLLDELTRAQIGETQAQGQQRLGAAAREEGLARLRADLLARLQSPSAPSQYGLEGGGVTMGGVREPMRPVAGGLAGMSIEDIARAKLAGLPDLTNDWKLSQTGVEQDAGKYYTRNGQREFLSDPVKGIRLGADGGVSLMPGAAAAMAQLAGATKGAEAEATAPYTPFSFVGPGNVPMTTTLDRFRASLGGQPGSAYAPAPTTPAGQAARVGEVQQAEDEIRKWAEGLRPRSAGAPVAAPAAGPAGLKTGLGPADKWMYDRDRGLMVNEAGQSRPVTNTDNVPIGSPKQEAEAKGNNQFLEATKQARLLLAKNPTGSAVGTAQDTVAGWFGASPSGAKEAAQLRTISGWLMSNVPRMEGPQSNYDVQNYREMAAIVGDSMKPVAQRIAALDSAENLIRKYAELNRATPANPGLKDSPADNLQSAIAAELERRRRALSGGATGSW